MDSEKPLVSVIIPVYNQAPFLPITLDSVRKQTYPHLEIIIIDDGSTDETSSISKNYAQSDSRIRYIRQVNKGPAAARNQGIAQALGDYICLLDADDLMQPERIEKQLKVFKDDPTIDIVYTALFLIDQEEKLIGEIHSQDYPSEEFLVQMLFRNIVPTASIIMAKRACMTQHLYNEHFRHAEDYELMLSLAHSYHFKYMDEPLTSYRRHSQNLSNNLVAHHQAELKILHQYSPEKIEELVEKTDMPKEEKILMKGKILFKMELWFRALEIFRNSSSALAYFYIGNCYLKINRQQAAKISYQQSLQIDTNNPACYNNLGVILASLGDILSAKNHFEQALKLKPGYLDASYNLAQATHKGELKITWRELRKDLVPYHKEFL